MLPVDRSIKWGLTVTARLTHLWVINDWYCLSIKAGWTLAVWPALVLKPSPSQSGRVQRTTTLHSAWIPPLPLIACLLVFWDFRSLSPHTVNLVFTVCFLDLSAWKQPAPQPCMWSDLSLGSAHGSWVKWACGWKLEIGLGSYPMSRWGFWDVRENYSWKEKNTRPGLVVLHCHVLSRSFKAYRSLT